MLVPSGLCVAYFLCLESLGSKQLQEELSYLLQVFAQIYLFNEVYPDHPNLKWQLTLFYPSLGLCSPRSPLPCSTFLPS